MSRAQGRETEVLFASDKVDASRVNLLIQKENRD
jgi:hypothetical protein